MSLHHSSHHFHHFLKNKEMNELYLSYGIFNFALGLISVFVPIYLYKIDYSIQEILLFFFINSLSFVAFSYPGAKVVSKLGVKHTMLMTAPLLILFFIGLSFIREIPVLFFLLPILRAMKMILFNYSFHLNFIQHADKKKRGQEFSMAQASATFAGILSPLIGGIIIHYTGFSSLFYIGSFFLFVAMIPLFFTKDTYEKINFNQKNVFVDIFKKKNRSFLSSFSGYAVESWIGMIVWPIFLFVLAFSMESIGAITSISTLMTFLIFYFVGKATDAKDKKKLIRIGTFLYFFGWVGRIFVTGMTSALFIDTYKNLAQKVVDIPWSARFYDIAAKRDYFKLIVEREIIFNLTRTILFPILILVFLIDLRVAFAITFAIAAFSSLFYITLNNKIDSSDSA